MCCLEESIKDASMSNCRSADSVIFYYLIPILSTSSHCFPSYLGITLLWNGIVDFPKAILLAANGRACLTDVNKPWDANVSLSTLTTLGHSTSRYLVILSNVAHVQVINAVTFARTAY